MNYRTLARAIAAAEPDLTPFQVLNLVDALLPLVTPVVNSDPESLGAHALTLPLVVEAAKADLKIQAIKHLRAATKCGLKEAKDAIESKAFTAEHLNMTARPYYSY
jgi:ribosomal protein L7/L12